MSWGAPPWTIDFAPEARPLPPYADFVVVGGGFSGLAAAAWLRHIARDRSVVLLEASALGAGASGRTGGLALSEPPGGPLAGLEDLLGEYAEILAELGVEPRLVLPGVFEIGRAAARPDSAIVWQDQGTLRVVRDVPGGGVDPGKIVSGLARAASRLGAVILENQPVRDAEFGGQILLRASSGTIRAAGVILATNAQSAALSGLAGLSRATFTLAVLTGPLPAESVAAAGLASRKAFYTVDLPYLWGRPMPDGGVIFGSGLVDLENDAALVALDIETKPVAEMFAKLESRIRGLHPAFAKVRFARRWGGPIRFGNDWQFFFDRHPRSPSAIVVNGLGGDGVALSVCLGRWAAEALAGGRALPKWGKIPPPR